MHFRTAPVNFYGIAWPVRNPVGEILRSGVCIVIVAELAVSERELTGFGTPLSVLFPEPFHI